MKAQNLVISRDNTLALIAPIITIFENHGVHGKTI